ncbi:MAG: hypothetical protein IJV70_07505 [Clostridia bacterium]|nr:hypothetical protein [Clostridia bacterium]
MNHNSIYGSLERLYAQRSNLYKKASDGLHSEAPDDPTGDGTVEPTTGDLFATMDKEIQDYPITDVTAADDGTAFNSDVTANLDNIGTEVTEFDDSVVDEYSMDVEDPGTESQVKFSQYKFASMSFSQNHQVFKKLASALAQDLKDRAAGALARTKQAGYAPAMTSDQIAMDRFRKAKMIIEEGEKDGILMAKNAAFLLRKAANGEAVTPEDIPVDAVEDIPVETAPEEAVLDPAAEEAAAVLSELPPETVEALVQLPEEELQAIEEMAAAVDAGAVEPEEAIAMLAGEEGAPSEEAVVCDETGCTAKEAAYRRWMYKLAEEAPLTEEDVIAAADVPADDLAAIEALPPEAIEELIALEEAVDAGDIPAETAIALLEGDPGLEAALEEAPVEEVPVDAAPVSEDEAVAELSSAMAEQGVTPDDLEAAAAVSDEIKSASLRKIARSVRVYRTKYAAHTRSKTARRVALRRHCKNVLSELLD